MVFVADDLTVWMVGLLADAGRLRLTTLVFGSDQERALRQAASSAVQLTARELCPDSEGRAVEMAMVINQVFSKALPGARLAGSVTLLEALQAGIVGQLDPLDDAALTGTGQSSAELLGVSATVLADKLSSYLVREIVVRGSRGGPLAPLADQVNHDLTHLQGHRVESILAQLAGEVRVTLARLGDAPAVSAAPVALAQLPRPTEGFIGRDDDLAVLAGLLDPAAAAGLMVVSVAGLAGVGKTTLAVQAGHAAQSRGWFSGGVLFIDLHGYDDVPVQPGQALDALLRALGVPGEHIPPNAEGLAGLYRSVLAEMRGPVLLIADNASSEAQVRPLLPGSGNHRVVITSRHTLAGLDARLVDVTVLDKTASMLMMEQVLRGGRPGDDRIAGDRDAAERLAGICGGLPLALRIVAALLKADIVLSAAELADDLAVERDRLERLRYDDGSGPGVPSVEAAFGLSYRRLDATSARVFRLLSVNPGPDVPTATAAVLADLPEREVRGILGHLAGAHLVDGTAGRWRMHDLLRLYSQRLSDVHAGADRREQVRNRLLRYYLDTAEAADEHLQALPGTIVPPAFTGRDSALAWLDAERPCLIAAVTMAASTGSDQVAILLPLSLGAYFDWRRRFEDWLATVAISLKTARHLGDRFREGSALNNLGLALREMRRFEEAITAHRDAAAIFRETGNQHEEGAALANLGSALAEERRFEEAITAHQEDLVICREIGDRHGEGMALANLGLALEQVARFEEAISAHRDAAAIYRETGDRFREGITLNNLGLTLLEAGRLEEAITLLEEDLVICREIGDRHGEGMALANLGSALRQMARFEEAISAHRDAAVICREIGDRHSEGMALSNLGVALWETGRFEEAITAFQGALAIYRETSDRHREGNALANLGLALQGAARFEEAMIAHGDAAAIYRETGDQHSESIALGNLETARAAQHA